MMQKYLMRTLVIFLYSFTIAFAQQNNFSRVKVYTGEQGLQKLAELGIAVDHGEIRPGVYFISDFSGKELDLIRSRGFKYEVLIEDVVDHYILQNNISEPLNKKEGVEADVCGTFTTGVRDYPTPNDWSLGSMGGYFTYDELLDHLDNMAQKYPGIISVKKQIGSKTTVNGRPIYWVRISDSANVDQDEPEVLYSALHHAREPLSLSQLVFYMYYLLENYGTDKEVTWLVDNTEMYFVPCVNPDGYIYNAQDQPNGGGLWRKNRSFNSDGSRGVDINRNYGHEWGFDNIGSSDDPSVETYRGEAPFSEPETQIMKEFCEAHDFKLVLNYHSFGNFLIHPFGYNGKIPPGNDSIIFKDFADVMTKENGYLAGTPQQTVGYAGNGAADDWMYAEQTSKNKIYSYSPEAGNGVFGFWPPKSEITSLCKELVYQNLHLAHLAGQYVEVKDEMPTLITARDGYLRFSAKQLGFDTTGTYTVSIRSVGTELSFIGGGKTIAGLSHLEEMVDSIPYSINSTVMPGDRFQYVIFTYNTNGKFVKRDTITKTFGQEILVFTDSADNLMSWDTLNGWDLTLSRFHSPPSSFTDSPDRRYPESNNSQITLTQPLDLSNCFAAYLRFYAIWQIEEGWDYGQVMVSDDSGSTWIPVCGRYTKPGTVNQDVGQPIYDGLQASWVEEEIDLRDFVGSEILIRFSVVSDDQRNRDGFYFDDLEVVKIISMPTGLKGDQFDDPVIFQNIPNPVLSSTRISYFLPENSGNGRLKIYSQVGQLLKSIPLESGRAVTKVNTVNWSPGIYFYRLENDVATSRLFKMVVVH